jgi:hypothetical protein
MDVMEGGGIRGSVNEEVREDTQSSVVFHGSTTAKSSVSAGRGLTSSSSGVRGKRHVAHVRVENERAADPTDLILRRLEEMEKRNADRLAHIDRRFASIEKGQGRVQGEQVPVQRRTLQEILAKEHAGKGKDIAMKSKANKDQYDFNTGICELTAHAVALWANNGTRPSDEDADELMDTLNAVHERMEKRQKLIRIADRSELGWSVVNEYVADPFADDSDDEKKLRKATKAAEDRKKEALAARKKTAGDIYIISLLQQCEGSVLVII